MRHHAPVLGALLAGLFASLDTAYADGYLDRRPADAGFVLTVNTGSGPRGIVPDGRDLAEPATSLAARIYFTRRAYLGAAYRPSLRAPAEHGIANRAAEAHTVSAQIGIRF